MSNPFKERKYNDIPGHNTYASLIREVLVGRGVGDSFKVPMHDRSISVVRTAVNHYGAQSGMNFKTKTDSTGQLWAMRVAD